MFRFLSVSLLVLTIQHVKAGETITELVPSDPLGKGSSFTKLPEPGVEDDKLKLNGALYSFRLQQLKDERYKHITINGSYVDTDPDREFPLRISSELFHASLKSLTMSGSKLDENSFVKIGELKDLEHLNLEASYITDESIPYIASLPKLKSLSLAATHISDTVIPTLLAIPSLKELDISENDGITNKSFDIILQDTNLEKVHVEYTEMSIKNIGIIRKKYN